MTHPTDESQRAAARVVGFAYLFAMTLSMWSELFVRNKLFLAGDAVATARNIVAHEQLFRLSIASELLTFVSDITLITGMYVILAPVQRHLALWAAFFRIFAASVCVMMAAEGYDVLRLLSDAAYLRVFEAEQLAALARLGIGAHGTTYYVAWMFLGLGSAVFSWLWWKSGYVPRALSALGIFASFLLAAGSFAFLTFPGLRSIVYPGAMVPMFVFEVTMGLVLLLRGIPASATSAPQQALVRAT